MRKVLFVLVMLVSALAAQAQEMYLGGGISLWRNDDADRTKFSIAPEFGYNLNSRWAGGGELVFSHSYEDGTSLNSFALAPYARFSFYENKIVRLFLDMGFGFSTTAVKDMDNYNGFEIGVKPGISIKLNNHFSLISKIGFAGFRDDYFRGENGLGVDLDGENISIGIDYEF